MTGNAGTMRRVAGFDRGICRSHADTGTGAAVEADSFWSGGLEPSSGVMVLDAEDAAVALEAGGMCAWTDVRADDDAKGGDEEADAEEGEDFEEEEEEDEFEDEDEEDEAGDEDEEEEEDGEEDEDSDEFEEDEDELFEDDDEESEDFEEGVDDEDEDDEY